MKNTKLIDIFATIFVACFSLNSLVFATNTTNTESDDIPPTGTTEEICNLGFRVGYIGDSFNGNIAVVFKDIATDKEYQFLLEAEKGYNASELYEIRANTTYKVTLSYPDDDKFEIVNADGSNIKSYHATTSGLNIIWQINEKKVEDTTKDKKNTHGEESAESEIKTSAELLNSFIQKTNFIADNRNFQIFLGNWAGARYKKLYLDIKGNTEESWDQMSTYQKACYSLLFTAPKSRILGGNGNANASSRNMFLNGLQFAKQELENINKGNIVYDAIVEVWDWHFDNWKKIRTFINPFEDITYDIFDIKQDNDLELHNDEEDKTLENSEKNNFQKNINIPESKEIKESDNTDLPSSEKHRNELSNPKNFLSIILDNIVTFIILIGVGIALLVIYIKNKKNNCDN